MLQTFGNHAESQRLVTLIAMDAKCPKTQP